jgi:hypothetical protein
LKYEKIFFFLMVLLAVSIVAIPACYVTGDGPSHTYNAKVWFDYLFSSERNFYKPFYQLNKQIEPNWMSHLLLGLFTRFLKPLQADKLFQVLYVFLFAYGFRSLIYSLREENKFLSYLFFPFVFTLAFQQGFYNYSIALAFMFWSLAYYLKNYQEISSMSKAFMLCLWVCCTALSHGMVAAYTLALIALLWLFLRFRELIAFQFRFLLTEVAALLLVAMPALIIVGGFIFRTGLDTVPHALSMQQKLLDWGHLSFLISTKKTEFYPLLLTVLLLAGGLLYSLFQFRSALAIGWIFFLFTGYTVYAYLFAPHSIGGAGSVDIRLAFLPLLFAVLFMASVQWTDVFKKYIPLGACLLLIALLAIRFPAVLKASDLSEELLSCRKQIQDHSVVLNLHFDDAQQLPNNKFLFEQDASFIHLTDYLGAYPDKHLILINNYEADLDYFPLHWRSGISTRFHTPGFTPGNYPPCDDYRTFEKQTHVRIDYILFQNWNSQFKQQACVQTMLDSIAVEFEPQDISASKHLILYRRK